MGDWRRLLQRVEERNDLQINVGVFLVIIEIHSDAVVQPKIPKFTILDILIN